MRLGVQLPFREPCFDGDTGAIAEYTQAAEALGFHFIGMGEHVLGANPASRPRWKGPFNYDDSAHDPFVLFAYLAALTKTVEFVTEILILPQRQTALVAKQAATLDLVSGGRLRLGIGVGWNPVEFEALGQDFSTRGRRCEEQIEVMRALWTQDLVTYRGRWDTIIDAGLNPSPVQRPIPIWIGGGPGAIWIGHGTGPADDVPPAHPHRVLRRVARMGDGWFPSVGLETGAREAITTLHRYIREEGRDMSEVGIEGSFRVADSTPEDWARQATAWKELGATHLAADATGAALTSVQEHIDALQRVKEAVG